GVVPWVKLPYPYMRVKLPTDSTFLTKHPPETLNLGKGELDSSRYLCKTTVSQDPNCEYLAVQHGANIVITPSALKVLVDNPAPNFDKEFDIPVVIRSFPLKGNVSTSDFIQSFPVKSYLTFDFIPSFPVKGNLTTADFIPSFPVKGNLTTADFILFFPVKGNLTTSDFILFFPVKGNLTTADFILFFPVKGNLTTSDFILFFPVKGYLTTSDFIPFFPVKSYLTSDFIPFFPVKSYLTLTSFPPSHSKKRTGRLRNIGLFLLINPSRGSCGLP
ncbi:hypothetical protein FHG87_016081, partial [Trinorchestia longiramus]